MLPWSNQGKCRIGRSLLQPNHIPGLLDSWQMQVDERMSKVLLLAIQIENRTDA